MTISIPGTMNIVSLAHNFDTICIGQFVEQKINIHFLYEEIVEMDQNLIFTKWAKKLILGERERSHQLKLK